MRSSTYLLVALLLTGCAAEQPTLTTAPALFAQATDPTPQPPLLGGRGKVKFNGPVSITYQLGNGNQATPAVADNRQAGANQGSAAIGKDASAANTSKRSSNVSPWWFAAAAAAGAVVWGVVRSKWVAWWPRPG